MNALILHARWGGMIRERGLCALAIVGNMITGSTTVGVVTSASITAPMMPTLGLSPEATMLAAAAGSIITKYVNSSYFWVCTTLTRMPLRSALISFGGVMIVNGVVSMAVIYVLWRMGVSATSLAPSLHCVGPCPMLPPEVAR